MASNSSATTPRRSRMWLLNRRLGLPVMVFAAFGMLFWMKLKLSVDVPRMAYAEPEPKADPEPGEGDPQRSGDGAGAPGLRPDVRD